MTGATDLYVVLGATGGIGRAVVTEAAARGHRVRAVSRSAGSARDLPVGVERLSADVPTTAGAATAVVGAAVVVHAAQPDYTRWPEEFPTLTAAVADATAAEGAKLVLTDNLYMYGPQPYGRPMREDTPTHATDRKGRVRAAMAADLVVPVLRELAGVACQWQHPFVVDDRAFRTAFPDAVRVTAHPGAAAVTVDWWRGRVAASAAA